MGEEEREGEGEKEEREREREREREGRVSERENATQYSVCVIFLLFCRDIYAAVKESSAQEVELGGDGSWRPVQSKSL